MRQSLLLLIIGLLFNNYNSVGAQDNTPWHTATPAPTPAITPAPTPPEPSTTVTSSSTATTESQYDCSEEFDYLVESCSTYGGIWTLFYCLLARQEYFNCLEANNRLPVHTDGDDDKYVIPADIDKNFAIDSDDGKPVDRSNKVSNPVRGFPRIKPDSAKRSNNQKGLNQRYETLKKLQKIHQNKKQDHNAKNSHQERHNKFNGHSHQLKGHPHQVKGQGHQVKGQGHQVKGQPHHDKGHARQVKEHTHQVKEHAHQGKEHEHQVNGHAHQVKGQAHQVKGHPHQLKGHSRHQVNGQLHDVKSQQSD